MQKHFTEKKLRRLLDLAVLDREGDLFRGTSDAYGMSFGSISGKGRILIVFDNIPANSERLDFSFSLFSRNTREMFDWRRNVRIRIRKKHGMFGRISLGISWKIIHNQTTTQC
jgi:hypothetical protein